MEILTEDDPELEDPVQQPPPHTTERTCIDVLLSISEETSMNNLGPFEYTSYSGWEEVVCGWAQASPLSCMLLTEENHRENDNLTSSSTHVITLSKAESSVDQRKNKTPTSAGRRSALHSHTCLSSHQCDTVEESVFNTMKRNMGNLLINDKMEEKRPSETPAFPLKCIVSENNHLKHLKYSQRPNEIPIPLKNVILLPRIWSPVLNPKRSPCRGKMSSSQRRILDKPSSGRRRVDTMTTPHLWKCISEDQTFQLNSKVFPVDKMYGISVFPELPTSHKPSCPMGNRTPAILNKAHVAFQMRNQTV